MSEFHRISESQNIKISESENLKISELQNCRTSESQFSESGNVKTNLRISESDSEILRRIPPFVVDKIPEQQRGFIDGGSCGQS